jgi:hypothetical protein
MIVKTTVKLTPVTITVAAGNAPADLDYSLDGSSIVPKQ